MLVNVAFSTCINSWMFNIFRMFQLIGFILCTSVLRLPHCSQGKLDVCLWDTDIIESTIAVRMRGLLSINLIPHPPNVIVTGVSYSQMTQIKKESTEMKRLLEENGSELGMVLVFFPWRVGRGFSEETGIVFEVTLLNQARKKKLSSRHWRVITGFQGSDSLTWPLAVVTPHSPLTQCSLWQSQETTIIMTLSGTDSPQGKTVSRQ